jgi:uncharacterized membrane-anchored protein
MNAECDQPFATASSRRQHPATEVHPPAHRAQRVMRKVPEVTAYFWITKVLTTAMGESTSDYLVHRFDPFIAVALGAFGLVVALSLQFNARRYVAAIYWLAVAMVAIFGTMAADVVHLKFGVPYVASTVAFAVVLAVVFLCWNRSEKTLSIHSITTPRRELFYWATVMATFALGTAAGDMTAMTMHLGYLSSGLLFAVLIAVPALAYWRFGLNEVFAFWFAYIVTRPLGASFADWTGKPEVLRGLGWGDGKVSFALAALIIVFVAYLSYSKRDVGAEHLEAIG